MLIAIEAERANTAQKTGVEHYAKQLILSLAAIDKKNNYLLYLRTKPEQWFLALPKNFQIKVMPFPLFWTQIRLSLELWLHPVDVLFIPASALPIFHPKRSVVTIHDLAWKYFPASFTWFMRNFLEASTRFAVKAAHRVIAVSHSTRADLIRFYDLDPKKIAVVHHGYNLKADLSQDFKQITGLDLPKEYLLFVSTLQPRKNLQSLITAFRELKLEHPELPHKLVVAGKPGWKFNDILKVLEANRDEVIYLNHVSEADKAVLFAGASALVVPSFYEGFGMQILEAFAANTPVITSRVSSLPEVAGEAAEYFDPGSISDIKNAIKRVLFDKSLRDNLAGKGEIRLRDFSWEKCAKETLEVLTKFTCPPARGNIKSKPSQ